MDDMIDTPEFRVTVKVRNNRLIRAREDLGMSAPKLAKAAGVSHGTYVRYESMSETPIKKVRRRCQLDHELDPWKESAKKIAAYHGFGCSYFWPESVLGVSVASSTREMHSDQLSLAGPAHNPEARALRESDSAGIKTLMAGVLTRKEEAILRMRFGFDERTDPDNPQGYVTLDDVSKRFGLSRERIRQIESLALRKLRNHGPGGSEWSWDRSSREPTEPWADEPTVIDVAATPKPKPRKRPTRPRKEPWPLADDADPVVVAARARVDAWRATLGDWDSL